MYKQRFTAWNIRKNEKRQPGQVQAYKRKRKRAELGAEADLATNLTLPVGTPIDQALIMSDETMQTQQDYPDILQQMMLQGEDDERGYGNDHNAITLTSHNARWPNLPKTSPDISRLQQFWNPDINSFSGFTDHDKQEGCLFLIRDYITSRLNSVLWHFTPHRLLSKKSNRFTDAALTSFIGHVQAAGDLYYKGEPTSAEVELVNSSACIRPIITSEDPNILPDMLQLMYLSVPFYPIFKKILEQFTDMAIIILGLMHQMTRICIYLNHMMSISPEVHSDNIVPVIHEAMMDQFARHLGPLHPCVLDHRLEYLRLFPDLPHTLTFASTLKRDCELHLDRYDTDYLRVQSGVGWYQFSQGRLHEAQAIAYNVLDTIKHFNNRKKALVQREALELLSYVKNALGNIHAAEESYQEYLSLVIKRYGESSSIHIRCLVILENWYTRWGWFEKALAISEKRVQLQLSMMKLV